MTTRMMSVCLLTVLCVSTAYAGPGIFGGGDGDRYASYRVTATIAANKRTEIARPKRRETSDRPPVERIGAALVNNIAVTNVTLNDLNAGAHYIHITFDLSWKNSWRVSTAPNNWDAAWLFAKYRLEGSKEWQHAMLSTKDSDHAVPTGATLKVGLTGTNGMGAFIYRSSNGTGDVNYPGVQLRWNYGGAGLQDGHNVEIAVFAIEMVYIPEGSFYVGDGAAIATFASKLIGPAGVVVTCQKNSETFDDLQLKGDGILIDGDDGIDMDGTEAVDNADFPTGYKAFYIMKAELSQGQYTDFLNLLTDAQDDIRYPNMNGQYRHTITGSYAQYTTTTPARACNYLYFGDGAAYADWAGLRPMTELEFEKACRGPESAVAGEYAWGNTKIKTGRYTIQNDGQPNAIVTNLGAGIGNANYQGTDKLGSGPLRCGIFAASKADPTREEAGATYYGVMEMSGNLFERCVTIGNIAGRRFAGTHGDGSVISSGEYAGNATNSDWPGYRSDRGVHTGAGSGARGGGNGNAAFCEQVSDRKCACCGPCANRRRGNSGWRGVRSAP